MTHLAKWIFAFLPLCAWAIPQPVIRIKQATITIHPTSEKECRLEISSPKGKGTKKKFSSHLPCDLLEQHLREKLTSTLPHPTIKIEAPEHVTLNILLQEGTITSFRKNVMKDAFQVAKGDIEFKANPDHFDRIQEEALSFDIDTALKELETTLP